MRVECTRMYRVGEVAEHFSVSESTIYRAVESGLLDALRLGRAVRVTGRAVLAYAEACGLVGSVASGPYVAGIGELSLRQAEGSACVRCGADLLAGDVARRPVGRLANGFQIFACAVHDKTLGRGA